jgi:iron complex transport system substrate-binding protein
MRNFTLYFLTLVAQVCMACASADVPPLDVATREVRDDLGRTVVVPEKIDRAISLAPSVTEMIFAVGAGDRLVGVTTYCNYPPEATKIEKIGDTQTPNIEKIIALKPQVVFVSTDSQLEAFSRTLDEQGIAVYVTNPKALEEVFANMKELGDLFRTSERSENEVAALAGRASFVRHLANYDRAATPPGPSEKLRVFVQISNDPLFTIGKDSFLTELVEQAGGVSVTKDVPTAYPTLSKETAAALDPDIIILSDSEDNREPNDAFKNSKAVRDGRVYRINADIISRPGPRLVDALEQIAERLREK